MRIIVFICTLFFTVLAQSQSYDLTVAGRFIGWNLGFNMKGVTVEPTRFIVHTSFHNKYQTRTLNIPQSLELYIPDIYRSILVSTINGAGFGANTMKSGKRYSIDFVFPVDWNELTRYSDNALFIMNILKMRLTTNKDFTQSEPVWNSSDWRFDFQLPLTIEQQLTLGCAAYLSKLTVKSEFETTAAYNARLTADSLKVKIMDEMQRLLPVIARPDIARLNAIKPQLVYDADAESFTVDYVSSLTRPAKIKVPIAKAKDLKDGYASGKFLISMEPLGIAKEGHYLIGTIKIYNTKEKTSQTFANTALSASAGDLQWLVNHVINEIAKKHVNGKLLKS